MQSSDRFDSDIVLECLAKIESSKGFRRSERMKRFLRYVVERSLEGRIDELRELNLGVDVYDRGGMFDPSVDNIVRVDATRLRGKLAGYYELEGFGDPLKIELPKGGYVAIFSVQDGKTPAQREPIQAEAIAASRRAIAVMPFVSRSEGDLGEALTDEVIALLGSQRQLRVAARSAVSRYRGQDYEPKAAAADLGAGVLLEGRVRERDGRVQADAELIDAKDGFQLWSRRYESESGSGAIDVIAERIAAGVKGRLLDTHASSEGGAESAALCERGFKHLRACTLDDLEKAIACFESARRADPEFSAPYCGLALCRGTLAETGLSTDAGILDRAGAEARKAVELADTDATAKAAVGYIETLSCNWSAVDEATRLAVEGDRESVEAHIRRGFFLQCRGRFAESQAELEIATSLDGIDECALTALGWTLYCARDFAGALQQAHAAAYFEPRYSPAHLLAAACCLASGASEEAEASCREALLICPRDPWARALVGDLSLLEQASSHVIAAAIRLRSDKSAAVELLQKAVDARDPQLLKLRWPLFDPVRSDHRFDAIARRVFGA